MNTENKINPAGYVAPEIIVLKVIVEKGFGESNGGGNQLPSWEII